MTSRDTRVASAPFDRAARVRHWSGLSRRNGARAAEGVSLACFAPEPQDATDVAVRFAARHDRPLRRDAADRGRWRRDIHAPAHPGRAGVWLGPGGGNRRTGGAADAGAA